MYIPRHTFFFSGGVTLAKDTCFDSPDISYPCITQPKYNGVRGIFFPVEGKMVSRTNHEITSCRSVIETLKTLHLQHPVDGELIVRNEKNFDTASGLIRQACPIDQLESNLIYIIFDCITTGDIKTRLSQPEFGTLPEYNFHQKGSVFLARTLTKFVPAQIKKAYLEYLEKGYEGLMIRDSHSSYIFKRSKTLLRIKPWETGIARLEEITEGKNRLTGTMGAVIARDTKTGNSFSVGSGFSDVLRDDIWQNLIRYKNRLFAYQYQELSKNNKPKQPTFMEFL